MSQDIQDFITGLREKMAEEKVDSDVQESLIDEILTEYEMVPGNIREIAWAVLVNAGFLGLANEATR
tara:strand:+ start:620 stop:820 length:201 start_codon:yes stop_codon:yes gene_type:complete